MCSGVIECAVATIPISYFRFDVNNPEREIDLKLITRNHRENDI